MGRKTKYTTETIEKILYCLSEGVSVTGTCEYAGIHVDTYYVWLRNKTGFKALVHEARAKAEIKAIDKVMSSPATALKWLERQRRDEYRPPQLDIKIDEDIRGIVMVTQSEAVKKSP